MTLPTESDIPMHGWAPYGDVHRERIRAHEKHSKSGESIEQLPASHPIWLAVLMEEVGEVAAGGRGLDRGYGRTPIVTATRTTAAP